jgi:hypothetical protein
MAATEATGAGGTGPGVVIASCTASNAMVSCPTEKIYVRYNG